MLKNSPTPDISQLPAMPSESLVSYQCIESHIKYMAGKILTIIDASVSNELQNKSVKDLIKSQIKETLFQFQDACFHGSMGQSVDI
jgi:hypothetical protein